MDETSGQPQLSNKSKIYSFCAKYNKQKQFQVHIQPNHDLHTLYTDWEL
jgi:hypothetical protein